MHVRPVLITSPYTYHAPTLPRCCLLPLQLDVYTPLAGVSQHLWTLWEVALTGGRRSGHRPGVWQAPYVLNPTLGPEPRRRHRRHALL